MVLKQRMQDEMSLGDSSYYKTKEAKEKDNDGREERSNSRETTGLKRKFPASGGDGEVKMEVMTLSDDEAAERLAKRSRCSVPTLDTTM